VQKIPREIGVTPKAILVISAHWEEREFTVQTHPQPPMLYDYSGFPKHTYEVNYSAHGAPKVATRVQELLCQAGIKTRTDGKRGYDVRNCVVYFLPASLMFPFLFAPHVVSSLLSGTPRRQTTPERGCRHLHSLTAIAGH
jgi:aromatic ring-opening dioxygenase catalytic subunit (LigB family)